MSMPEGNLPANISIIDSVQIQQVQTTMQKICQFQNIVRNTLKSGHDYGIIPGTGNKPTLLKPGAEKILMLMGLTSEYDVTEKVQDYENGFFAFTVKCTIFKGPLKITEGLGHANTKESRYMNRWVTEKKIPEGIDKASLQTREKESKFKAGETYTEYLIENSDGYTLANTVLKMAKKRAQVDAALTVSSLSDIFTQDLEDLVGVITPDESLKQGQSQRNEKNKPLSDAQVKRLYAIARSSNVDGDMLKAWADTYLGGKNPKELSRTEYDELCTAIEDGTVSAWYSSIQGDDDNLFLSDQLEVTES